MVGLFFLILSSTACKKDMDVTHHTQTDVSTYFSRESTLSQYDIEAWFESQYDTLKPHSAAMILHIIENADFGSMYADSLDEERNVVVVPMRPDYFSQHIPLESTPLQNLVLIEDGEIIQGNLFIYFPEDPQYEVIPMGGIRDFYYNAHQFLDQSGKLKVVTLSDLKLSEFEYEAGVLHTSTVLSSEWDEEGSIENERRCQAWTLVRYYYDLVTGEILDYDILAEGNNCDNECPPGDMFCDEGMGGGAGPEEPNWESVNKQVTVTVYENTNTYGVHALVTLQGRHYPGFTSLNTFTVAPTASLLTNGGTTCYNPFYCLPTHDWYLIPIAAGCNCSIQNPSKATGRVQILLSKPNVDDQVLHSKPFEWLASSHLF
ncbi:MAG: hypothetical protein KF880_07835 [Ferruginibacter sp.]|nr:hypothetical protein [Ferruginibacter sp.]